MAIESVEKCGICRFSCKSEVYKTFCKFYPKGEFLDSLVDDKEVGGTRRTCLVCKASLNYRKTHWKRDNNKWYPVCKECAKNALFIEEIVGVSR
jgi:hypothetical protein